MRGGRGGQVGVPVACCVSKVCGTSGEGDEGACAVCVLRAGVVLARVVVLDVDGDVNRVALTITIWRDHFYFRVLSVEGGYVQLELFASTCLALFHEESDLRSGAIV